MPSAAIVREGSRDTVWAVEAGRAHRRTVKLGAQGDEYVQVLEGVKPGERIVTHGADRVRESQRVK